MQRSNKGRGYAIDRLTLTKKFDLARAGLIRSCKRKSLKTYLTKIET